MTEGQLIAYSNLLLDYCLQVKEGQQVFIQSTTLAEPLITQLYKGALCRNTTVEVSLTFKDQEDLFNQNAHESASRWVSPAYAKAMETFDSYLFIRAPFESKGYFPMDKLLMDIRRKALAPYQKMYSMRTGNKTMRRTLCQYPTQASAKEAGMSLGEYEDFVMGACFLLYPDPAASWRSLSANQLDYVAFLNQVSSIRYTNNKSDISFSVNGRTWINSDGQTNMPSGEIYTSPVEDSAEGFIYFDYPVIYQQRLMQGIHLDVKQGNIIKGKADQGQEVLDEILEIPGARRFGEAAIGMNQNIQRATKNILFDEKIAGSVHMAMGQSYEQCGGKNESSLHLDLISDMRDGGKIFADEKLIYQSGKFLF
ncbi:MAG: aminopeptidase [Saprospiraceae bacterium]